MAFRDRFAQLRQRLRHCNIVVAAFVVALVGLWDELKPLVQNVVSNYLSPDNVGVVMSGLGILVLLVRAGVAMVPAKDEDGGTH